MFFDFKTTILKHLTLKIFIHEIKTEETKFTFKE